MIRAVAVTSGVCRLFSNSFRRFLSHCVAPHLRGSTGGWDVDAAAVRRSRERQDTDVLAGPPVKQGQRNRTVLEALLELHMESERVLGK